MQRALCCSGVSPGMRSPAPPTVSGTRTVFGRVFFTVVNFAAAAVSLLPAAASAFFACGAPCSPRSHAHHTLH